MKKDYYTFAEIVLGFRREYLRIMQNLTEAEKYAYCNHRLYLEQFIQEGKVETEFCNQQYQIYKENSDRFGHVLSIEDIRKRSDVFVTTNSISCTVGRNDGKMKYWCHYMPSTDCMDFVLYRRPKNRVVEKIMSSKYSIDLFPAYCKNLIESEKNSGKELQIGDYTYEAAHLFLGSVEFKFIEQEDKIQMQKVLK